MESDIIFHERTTTRIKNAVIKRIKKPIFHLIRGMTGISIQSEVHYHHMSMMSAVFGVSAEVIKTILPSKKLIPIEREPDIAEIHFVAFEYRSIDILFPYNEFAIYVPVLFKNINESEGIQGNYYLYLPVTKEDARWGGVENLGLPKFVAEIGFKDEDNSRSCTLKSDNEEILTLTVNKLMGETRTLEFSNFGIRDGKLLKNIFRVHGYIGISNDPRGASFSLGNHRIAKNLEALGIGTIPFEHQYVPLAQAVLTKSLGSPEAL